MYLSPYWCDGSSVKETVWIWNGTDEERYGKSSMENSWLYFLCMVPFFLGRNVWYLNGIQCNALWMVLQAISKKAVSGKGFEMNLFKICSHERKLRCKGKSGRRSVSWSRDVPYKRVCCRPPCHVTCPPFPPIANYLHCILVNRVYSHH